MEQSRLLGKHEFSTDGRVIGRGASSTVTTGACHGETVAIKTFESPVDLQALRREAERMQMLSDSPNVVRLVGWCEEPACLVMEYYPLGSLRQVPCSRALHT
jgi:serine/threonine protein kinase